MIIILNRGDRMDRDIMEYIKELEDNWDELREYFVKYRDEKTPEFVIGGDSNVYNVNKNRYCVALSIDDILEKMKEIEEK